MTALMNRQTLVPGSTVLFGHYPQTERGTDHTPIEWLVLDVQDGKALLLSKYGLDALPYNTTHANVRWETCTLRAWLNCPFLYRAFTPEEQMGIVTTEVANDFSQGYSEWKNYGSNSTQDKVFLLSYAEANHYLGVVRSSRSSDDNPRACVHPTRYAIAQGAVEDDEYYFTADGVPAGCWWLRSPGSMEKWAASVLMDGNLDLQPVEMNTLCVRPAMWVNLSVEVF